METDRANLRLIRTGGLADPAAAAATHSTSRDRPARLDAVRLLSLDAHDRVLDWMSWQDATCLYARGAVAWTLGEPCLVVHGGTSRLSGERSIQELHRSEEQTSELQSLMRISYAVFCLKKK